MTIATSFDHIDVFYLANSLTIGQLRYEIHRAGMKASQAETFRDTEYQTIGDLWSYKDYVDCCQKAISRQQQNKPKQAPTTGHIDIEAIKARVDIVSIIEQYTRLRKIGKNFTGKCPIHNDKHPSMTVYPDQQSWHCYGCNRGGDVIAFIMAVETSDFKYAVGILGGR